MNANTIKHSYVYIYKQLFSLFVSWITVLELRSLSMIILMLITNNSKFLDIFTRQSRPNSDTKIVFNGKFSSCSHIFKSLFCTKNQVLTLDKQIQIKLRFVVANSIPTHFRKTTRTARKFLNFNSQGFFFSDLILGISITAHSENQILNPIFGRHF